MENKFNISDDHIIPYGLEFREEYMHSALSLYRAQKKKLWWKKLFLISGACAISAIILFVSLAKRDASRAVISPIADIPVESPILPLPDSSSTREGSIRNTAAMPLRTQENLDDISKDALPPSVNNQYNKRNAFSNESKRQSQETFDPGDSESSGFELPGQRSSFTGNKNFSSDKNETQSEVSSAKTGDEPETEAANVSNFKPEPIALLRSGTATTIAQPLNSSDASDHASSRQDLSGAAIHLNDRNTNFNLITYKAATAFSSGELAKAKPISASAISRWKPFMTLGLNPLSNFGSLKYDLQPDPIVSLGIDRRISHGLTLALGASYFSISGLSHPYTVLQTTYGQGFATTSTTIYTNKLQYLGLHPAVRKTFKSVHQLSFGYGLDYLVTGKNTITTENANSFETLSPTSTEAKGYVKGFRNFNHSLSLGYDYWLGKNKAIGVQYNFGLTDISNNKYFTSGGSDRNSMLSIHFKMYLK